MKPSQLFLFVCITANFSLGQPKTSAQEKSMQPMVISNADVIASFEKKEYDKAIVVLDARVKANPSDRDALLFLGDAYLNMGIFEVATDFFARVLALDSTNIQALFGAGKAAFARNDFRHAERFFQDLTTLDPQAKLPVTYLGQTYMQEAKFDEALVCYENLLELDPSNIDALNNMGILYQQTGNPGKAEAMFKKQVDISPNDAVSHLNLGMLYGTLGRIHEAVVHLNRAATIDTADERPFESLGLLFLQNKSYAEAEKHFAKVLSLDPMSIKARFGLVVVSQEQRKFEEALRLANEMAVLDSHFPQLHLIIGNIYFLKGDFDSAFAHAEMQVESEPNEPEGHFFLAEMSKLQGKTSQAEWEFEQTRRILQERSRQESSNERMNLNKAFGRTQPQETFK